MSPFQGFINKLESFLLWRCHRLSHLAPLGLLETFQAAVQEKNCGLFSRAFNEE
jgi:hypothetical protein